MSQFGNFLREVKEQVRESWRLSDAPAWITKYTYLRGTKYSFVNHEFQERILSDDARIVNTQKCSQIGMSEATARWGVAVANMIPDFSVITTFPFSGDAADFAKTRIDPFVESSPKLKEAINPKLNNSEIKQFNTSMCYFRGTNGKTAAISIPADCIISDEIDRSDPHVLTQYQSRLTHSVWKLRRNFSTPTIPKHGIAKEMESSLRFRNLCKCRHCNNHFLPSYFEHVKIPGFDGDLRSLNKNTLPKTRYHEAFMICPRCGHVLTAQDLGPEHREWVCENPGDNHEAHGYYVSPFDAPMIITPVDLLKASVAYARYSEFVNQNLGLEEEDASEALTLSHLNRAFLPPPADLYSSSIHAMGIDMGLICTIVIGRITLEGQFLITHFERVPIGKLQDRKVELQKHWKVAITVVDAYPYTDTVMQMQKVDRNCFGAIYSQAKKLETFTIKMFEGDEEEGKLPIHTCQINRDKCLDSLLGAFQRNEVVIKPMSADEDEAYQKMLLDMRRVQIFNDQQELVWTWVKSKEAMDHYHHATLYCFIAAQLRGTMSRSVPLAGVALPLAFKFSVRGSGKLVQSDA
jgi:hypothetical protein